MHKYCINKENILAHELNGLKVEVTKSSDKGRRGIKGKIIRESKNTLTIETREGKQKIVPKKEAELQMELEKGKIVVEGKDLIGRPEERIKIFSKKHRI